MCTRFLLLSTLLIATGCSHQQSLQVNESDQFAPFNTQAAEREATVTLHSGEEHAAQGLQVMPDSTSWLVPESNRVMSVPTHDVADVRFRSHGKGALDGLGLGVVIGGLSGAAIGLLSGDDPPCDEGWCFFRMTAGEKAALIGVGFGLVGGVVGLVVGGVGGSEDVYQISREPQPGTAQNDRGR